MLPSHVPPDFGYSVNNSISNAALIGVSSNIRRQTASIFVTALSRDLVESTLHRLEASRKRGLLNESVHSAQITSRFDFIESTFMKSYLAKLSVLRTRHGRGFASSLLREAYIRFVLASRLQHVPSLLTSTRYPQQKWIFIIGCYNSGTTLLRDIMGAHPDIATLPREGVRFTSAFPDMQKGGWIRMTYANRALAEPPVENATSIYHRACKDWSPWWNKDAPNLLEKSITHSFRMRLLESAFDSPMFVTTRRNGYCTAEGLLRRATPTNEAKETVGDRYPMELVAKQWVFINRKIDEDSRFVANCHSLTFEHLVEEPDVVVNRVFDYLDLPPVHIRFSDGILEVGEATFRVTKPNEQSLARLSAREVEAFRRVGGDLLNLYGY